MVMHRGILRKLAFVFLMSNCFVSINAMELATVDSDGDEDTTQLEQSGQGWFGWLRNLRGEQAPAENAGPTAEEILAEEVKGIGWTRSLAENYVQNLDYDKLALLLYDYIDNKEETAVIDWMIAKSQCDGVIPCAYFELRNYSNALKHGRSFLERDRVDALKILMVRFFAQIMLATMTYDVLRGELELVFDRYYLFKAKMREFFAKCETRLKGNMKFSQILAHAEEWFVNRSYSGVILPSSIFLRGIVPASRFKKGSFVAIPEELREWWGGSKDDHDVKRSEAVRKSSETLRPRILHYIFAELKKFKKFETWFASNDEFTLEGITKFTRAQLAGQFSAEERAVAEADMEDDIEVVTVEGETSSRGLFDDDGGDDEDASAALSKLSLGSVSSNPVSQPTRVSTQSQAASAIAAPKAVRRTATSAHSSSRAGSSAGVAVAPADDDQAASALPRAASNPSLASLSSSTPGPLSSRPATPGPVASSAQSAAGASVSSSQPGSRRGSNSDTAVPAAVPVAAAEVKDEVKGDDTNTNRASAQAAPASSVVVDPDEHLQSVQQSALVAAASAPAARAKVGPQPPAGRRQHTAAPAAPAAPGEMRRTDASVADTPVRVANPGKPQQAAGAALGGANNAQAQQQQKSGRRKGRTAASGDDAASV